MAKTPTPAPATSTAEAREQSLATLREQEAMRPVPSQEDADRIKLGEQVNAEEQQPEGPAADAAAEVAAGNDEAQKREAGNRVEQQARATEYTTRDAKAK